MGEVEEFWFTQTEHCQQLFVGRIAMCFIIQSHNKTIKNPKQSQRAW